MPAYLITYDLRRPGQNYNELFKAIQTFPWCHALESVWVIKSTSTAAAVRDALLPHIDGNDKLLVTTLTGEAAWWGLSKEISDWLKANL